VRIARQELESAREADPGDEVVRIFDTLSARHKLPPKLAGDARRDRSRAAP